MYTYNINVKEGTGGYFDYDNCDFTFGEYTTPFLPRIGETIQLARQSKKVNPVTGKPFLQYIDLLVRDVNYYIINNDKNGITLYVTPIANDDIYDMQPYECE